MEDKSGIPDLLLAEIEAKEQELQEKNKVIEYLQKKIIFPKEGTFEKDQEELTVSIFLSSTKPLTISGVALAEGIWKNVVYTSDEIKKACEDLLGKPIRVEHGNNEIFRDRVVGKVTKVDFNEILKALVFKADVTDKLAGKLVLDGTFKAVSLSTWMEKIPIDNKGTKFGFAFHFAELSLVENPACEKCFIFHLEQLQKDLKGKEIKDIVGEHLMQNDQELEVLETLEIEEIDSIPEKETEVLSKDELEALEREPVILAWIEENDEITFIELENEDQLEELRQMKNVIGYYYGYSYLYPYYGKYGQAYYPYRYRYRGKAKSYYPYKWRKYKKPTEKAEEPEEPKKVICKICKKEFGDFKAFVEHWMKEHKEQYGPYKPSDEYPEGDKYPEKKYGDELKMENLEEFKVVYNKRNKKYIVFKVPEKGLWKIVKVFDTEKEAREFAKSKGKEKEEKQKYPGPGYEGEFTCPIDKKVFKTKAQFLEHWEKEHKEKYGTYGEYKKPEEKQAEEEKDPHGCIIGKEQWDEETKKCIPLTPEEKSAYTDFIGKCMKAKKEDIPEVTKRMKACAAEWKTQKKEEDSAYTDFIGKCRKTGKSMKECADEWKKEKEEKSKEELAKKIKCPACAKKFDNKDELIKHWAEKHEEQYGPYGKVKKMSEFPELKQAFECPACEKKFKSKEAMIAHFNRTHAKEYGKYGEKKSKEEMSLAEEGEILEEVPTEVPTEKPVETPKTSETKPEIKPVETPVTEKPEAIPEVTPEEKPVEEKPAEVTPVSETKPENLVPETKETPVVKEEIKPEKPVEKPKLTEKEVISKLKEKLPKEDQFLLELFKGYLVKKEE